MNIGIVSFECPPANDRERSFPNKQRYCDKHGYDFLPNFTNLIPSTEPKYKPELHPSWNTVLYLKKYIERYDWLLWTDSDTYVINSDIKLEEFADNNYDMVIQCDYEDAAFMERSGFPAEEHRRINAGVVFCKNTTWLRNLLDRWWDTRLRKDCHSEENGQWEQLGLKHLIGDQGEKETSKIKTLLDHTTGFNVVPEIADKNTFMIHARKFHRDFSMVEHLIF